MRAVSEGDEDDRAIGGGWGSDNVASSGGMQQTRKRPSQGRCGGLSMRKASEIERMRERQLRELRDELGTLLAEGPLCQSLADSVFADVIHKASCGVNTEAAMSGYDTSSASPSGYGSGGSLSKLPTLNLDSDVVSEIAERIIRQKTHEIQERGGCDDSSLEPVSAKRTTKMDARSLSTLRRHVRDRDSGKFFSLLHGMIKTYIAKECDTSKSSKSSIGDSNDSRFSSKKRLRPGVRSQQLSELVERAVDESSLTHALVACKALMCQIRTNGSRAEPLHNVASTALQVLAQRFVPSVEQMRHQIQLYWKRHMLEGWQSRCSLTCVWRGQSRRTFELRRGPAGSQFYLVRGSNFALQSFGINTLGTGHLYFEVGFPSNGAGSQKRLRGVRIGWASTESPLAPNCVSRPEGIYPDVWRMLGYKPTQQSGRGNMSHLNELGARQRQWGLDVTEANFIHCEGKRRVLQWRRRTTKSILPSSSSSSSKSPDGSNSGVSCSKARSGEDGSEDGNKKGRHGSSASSLGPPYVLGCHYDSNTGHLWFSMHGGKTVSDVINVPTLRPGAFLIPSITCNADVRDWSGSVLLGEGSIEEADAKVPPRHGYNPAMCITSSFPRSASSSGSVSSTFLTSSLSPSTSTTSISSKGLPRTSSCAFAWTCISEVGVAYRNSPKLSDRWEQLRGPDEFESVYPKAMTNDGKWLVVTVKGHGTKYLPLEASGEGWGVGFFSCSEDQDSHSRRDRDSGSNSPMKPLFLPSSYVFTFQMDNVNQCRPFDPAVAKNDPCFGSGGSSGGSGSANSSRKGSCLKVSSKQGVATALRSCGVNFGRGGGTRVVLPAATRMDLCEMRVITFEIRLRVPAELEQYDRHVLLCRGGDV